MNEWGLQQWISGPIVIIGLIWSLLDLIRSKKPRTPIHHKVDAGPASFRFSLPQPTVTLTKATILVRIKNNLKRWVGWR